MIVKLREGFRASASEPIMLILSEEEKKTISQMGPEHLMVAFYPVDGGFTPELIKAWMYDGIEVAPKAEVKNDGPNQLPRQEGQA